MESYKIEKNMKIAQVKIEGEKDSVINGAIYWQ
jgi:CTP:phosphocholine cytidylyltransferase-like protein